MSAGRARQRCRRRRRTWMADFPKKISDDPHGAAVLIRRLIMEQAVAYWRRYLAAFALMAVSAGAPAASPPLLGHRIHPGSLAHHPPRSARLSSAIVAPLLLYRAA